MKKILILKRFEDSISYSLIYEDYLLKSDEEYESNSGERFLFDLFDCFDDFGPIMDTCLRDGATSFGGNCSSARLIQGTNQISFWSIFDENDTIHIMNFDDFLRLNDEFHYLTFKKPDFIIFRKDNKEVTIEGIWNKEN